MTISERLEKIKKNCLEFKHMDPDLNVLGSSFHKYQLNEVIEPSKLDEFEKKYGIELPAEYRSYLLEVANGGIGVEGKMFSVEESLFPIMNRSQNSQMDVNHYKTESILTEEKIITYLKKKIQNPISEIQPLEMEYSDGGYLFLSTISENKYYILILNGACKEEVFELTEVEVTLSNGESDIFYEIQPVVRFKDDQIKTLSFLDWIEDEQENWFNKNKDLNRKLASMKTLWYNYNVWDKNRQVFGAFMHNYELKETLTEDQICEFESKYNCVLPNEYRQYLKIVNNGGVGPYYGMYSLQNATVALNSGSLDAGNFVKYLELNPDHYSKDFPISESQIEKYILHRIHHPNEASIPIRLPKNAGGYAFVSEYGCGGYYIMPVNGIMAGQIWYLQKLDANKLTFELHDENGNLIESGSYGNDNDEDYFEIYPELKFKDNQASTVTFMEWMHRQQVIWFDELNKNKPVVGDENLNNENAFYPLAIGNSWNYKYAGTEMTSHVESCDENGVFKIANSISPVKSTMQKINGEYFSDSYEIGNMQMILKDDLKLGDKWEVKCKANGIDCVYNFNVKEFLPSFMVEGKEFKEVVVVEMASNMIVNGNLVSMNSFVSSYYAKGVGIILTTTSGVVGSTSSTLTSFELN